MSKRNKIIIFISLLITILFGIFLISRYLKNTNRETKFISLILEIDSVISSGYYNQAVELISSASKYTNSSLNYKRLLKRVFNLEDYINLEIVAGTAYEKYPADELILSIYIFALLKNGKSNVAVSILHNLDKETVQESLLIEAVIKNDSIYDGDNFLYTGANEKNVYLYKKLYDLTDNKKFLIDAALLYLENGDYKLAGNLLDGIASGNLVYRKLLFFIKYDIGNLDSALEMLDLFDCGFNIEEIKLLRIDIYIRQELYKKAQIAILEFLELYPDYSWTSYYNFIHLDFNQDISKTESIIEKGLGLYSDNKRLVLIIMDYYLKNNHYKDAVSLVRKYINMNESDAELDIILKQLEGYNNPEYLINRVRDLVNQNPQNSNASRYLAWNIFENNDMQNLQRFLNQSEKEGQAGWISFFRALIHVENEEYSTAIEKFKSSYNLENQWEILYNLAVIFEYAHNYQDAVDYYQRADNSFANITVNLKTKSILRTSLASLLYDIEDYELSYREVKNALDLDIYNLKANLLLKKLNSVKF